MSTDGVRNARALLHCMRCWSDIARRRGILPFLLLISQKNLIINNYNYVLPEDTENLRQDRSMARFIRIKSHLKLTKDDQNILKRVKKGSMDKEDVEAAIRIYEKIDSLNLATGLNRAVYYAKKLAEKTRTVGDYRRLFRLLVSGGSCLAAARLAREKILNYDAKDLYEKAIYDREISGRITDAYQIALEKAAFTGDEKDRKKAKEIDWLAADYYYPMMH